MFYYLTNLEEIDIETINTGRVVYMNSMFYQCQNLENLDLSNFDTSNVVDMMQMFASCYKLENLILTNFDTDDVNNMTAMFRWTNSLKILDISSFNINNPQNLNLMLDSIPFIEKIKTPNSIANGLIITLPKTMYDESGNVYTQLDSTTPTQIWLRKAYTVTANANGGSITSTTGWTGTGNTSTKSVLYNQTYGTLPSDVTKSGYTLAGWSLLPSGYTQVDYIQSSGTQYIDTEYYWTHENIGIHFDGTVLSNPTYQSLFGNEEYTTSSYGTRYFSGIPHGYNGSYSIWIGNGAQGGRSITIGDRFTIDIETTKNKNLSVSFNGIKAGVSPNYSGSVMTHDSAYIESNAATTVGNIFIFANHNTGGGYNDVAIQNISSMRLYAFKMYDNNVLVRDFIPCINDTTGKVGLYDLVEGKFYGNKASGDDFTYGSKTYVTSSTVVERDFDHSLYAVWEANKYNITYNLQNNTTYTNPQYDDTNYYIDWSKDFEISGTFNVSSVSGRHLIVGSYSGTTSTFLSLEFTGRNALLYIGNGTNVLATQSGVYENEDVDYTLTWDATNKLVTVTMKGTQTDISMSATKDISSVDTRSLRIGTQDHRETAEFNSITMKNMTITEPISYDTSVETLVPTRIGYQFSGWNGLIYSSDAEINVYNDAWTSSREFMQYADLAPYFDKFGLDNKYHLEFDIKSEDTSLYNSIQIYFLNGDNTRYIFAEGNGYKYTTVSSTEWTHVSFDFNVSLYNSSQTMAMLAFFGTYDTGNKPIVKNVRLSILPQVNSGANVSGLTDEPNGEVILYANWTPNTYTVNYNGNGNTGGSTTSSTHTYDVSKNLTTNGFTRTGYVFMGWNTEADGSGTAYLDEASVRNLTSTNNGTVTLYAQWREGEATFISGGTFNKTIKELANPTLENIGATTLDQNITSIQKYISVPSQSIISDARIVSINTSDYDIYAWYSNGTIYYYSEAINLYVNGDTSQMFRSMANVTEIDISTISTSRSTYMNSMFYGDNNLVTLDVSNFDTSNVTSFGAMFTHDNNLLNLNLSSFNTSNVLDFTSMFGYCNSFTTLDLSSFDMSGVTGENNMGVTTMLNHLISLEQLKTPSVYPSNLAIDLPKTMYDEEGNAYSSLDNTSPTEEWLRIPYTVTFDDNQLPSGYQRVEYIESTGTQYIDTDYVPKTNTKVELDLSFNGDYKDFQSYTGTPNFLGVNESDGRTAFTLQYDVANNNNLLAWFNKNYQIDGQSIERVYITNELRTNRNTLTIENGNISYGNSNQAISSKGSNNVHTMYLFGANDLYNNLNPNFVSYNMRVYEMKIYENNVLIKNYVPCINETTNKAGLYETVDRTFYGNNGTGDFNYSDINGIFSKQVLYNGQYGIMPEPTSEAYTFTGWNQNNLFNLNNNALIIGSFINANETIIENSEFSVYSINIKPNTTYTITNSGNSYEPGYVIYNASDEKVGGEFYLYRDVITFTTPYDASYIKFSVVTNPTSSRYEKDYFKIEEGNTSTGSNYITSSTVVTQDKDHTLMAVWTLNNYNIIFDKNNNSATGSMNNQSLTYNSSVNLSANTYSLIGYTFTGWNTKADGTGISYLDGASVRNLASSGNVILYAQWIANTYTVTFDYNDGVTNSTTKQVSYNAAYGQLPEPTREGYTFKGWNGKNKLNIDELRDYNNWSSEIVITGDYPTREGDKGYLLNLESNKVYTLSYTTEGTETGEFPRYFYLCKIINGDGYLGAYLTTTSIQRTRIIFSTDETTQWFLRVADSNIEYNFDYWFGKVTSIQLEENNAVTTYEPYYITSSTIETQLQDHTLTAIWEAKTAKFISGPLFNKAIKELANPTLNDVTYETVDGNITSIQKYSGTPSQATLANAEVVSTQDSDYDIYVWYENGIIYYYSEAGKLYVNADATYMFNRLYNVTRIDLINMDTSNTTNMGAMFYYCPKLTNLDISKFDTGKVANMASMFSAVSMIEQLDVSNFDTSSLLNASYMFANCSKLVSIDMSNFDLNNITVVSYIFADDLSQLKQIKTPSVIPSGITITLPKTMYDISGNSYTTLTSSTPTSTWLRDSTITDLSGNNIGLTLHNVEYTKDGIYFNGTNAWGVTSTLNYDSSTAVTLDFVINAEHKVIDDTNANLIMESSSNFNANPNSYYIAFNDRLSQEIKNVENNFDMGTKWSSGQDFYLNYAQNILQKNVFKHITIIFDNTSNKLIKMYVDNNLISLNDTSLYNYDSTGLVFNNYPLYIGSRNGSKLFAEMELKSLRVYNKALSAQEISNNNIGTITTDHLLVHYDFSN